MAASRMAPSSKAAPFWTVPLSETVASSPSKLVTAPKSGVPLIIDMATATAVGPGAGCDWVGGGPEAQPLFDGATAGIQRAPLGAVGGVGRPHGTLAVEGRRCDATPTLKMTGRNRGTGTLGQPGW